jgi:hypothetical protein
MSSKTVKTIAQKYGCSTFRLIPTTQDGRDHALDQGSTVFWFWFSSDKLVSVQEGKTVAATGLKTSVMQNLCTGQRTADVSLEIIAPDELAGASVYIDDIKRLGLSNGPIVMEVIDGLKSGKHLVRIEKDGYRPVVTGYDYEPNEYWPRDNEIRILIDQHVVQHR